MTICALATSWETSVRAAIGHAQLPDGYNGLNRAAILHQLKELDTANFDVTFKRLIAAAHDATLVQFDGCPLQIERTQAGFCGAHGTQDQDRVRASIKRGGIINQRGGTIIRPRA